MIIDQKIVFIWRNINYSGGHQNYGGFVDNEGNEVGYDLIEKNLEDLTFKEAFSYLESMEYGEDDAYRKFDVSELEEYYSYLYKIDPDAEVVEERVGDDAGQRTLYGVVYREENAPTFVLIKSEGDVKQVNTDPYAKKIAKWWGM